MAMKTRAGPSGIHGTGLFAACDIPTGDFVIAYEGRPTRGHRSPYILYFADGSGRRRKILGTGDARFINHSPHPNLELRPGTDPRFFALRNIREGEELTWDYGWT